MALLDAGMLEPVCSLELEFFILGRGCPEVLRHLRGRYPAFSFSGKGGGFWMELPGPQGPVLFRISGDGPVCSQDLVLEAALPETNAPSVARLVEQYLLPWLAGLEQELSTPGAPTRFRMGPDLHGHRSAFQINLAVRSLDDVRHYYQSLGPLVLTLSCLTGPGGISPSEGYVLAPRLFNHCRPGHYLGSDSSLRFAPIAYPRWRDYGSAHRAHFSLEYPRLPGAMLLETGILSLASLAYEQEPERFAPRFADEPITAARALNRQPAGGDSVGVMLGETSAQLTGLELQSHYLHQVVEPVLSSHPEAPEWTAALLDLWRDTLDARRNDRPCSTSDVAVKRPYLDALLGRADLSLGSPHCRAAYALCAALLHASIDIDELFSRPVDRLPLEDRRGALDRHLAVVPAGLLRELYLYGLKDALRFELAWQQVGPESAAAQLCPSSPPELSPDAGLYLSPRARSRARILHANRDDPWLSADWDRIEATDCFAYNHSPSEEAFIDDLTGEPI